MANSLLSRIKKGGLGGIDAPEILFDIIHPHINTSKFYKQPNLRERQKEFPSFSMEIKEETGERTLYINVYEKDYLYYFIDFGPFYTPGHYLNGIRKLTFLLHPGCHNNSSESIINIYPKIEVEPGIIEEFDITTKLAGNFHSKRSIKHARRINLKLNMATDLFKVRLYSEGYENNNHSIHFNQGDVFIAKSIPSSIRYYADGYGYREKSGIKFNYFMNEDGYNAAIRGNEISYENRITNIFPNLRTCYIPRGYDIQVSYTNLVHSSGDFLGPDAPEVPLYKSYNEKEVIYKMLQGNVEESLDEKNRKERLGEYKFFIEKILPVGVPVTFTHLNGMKKYFGHNLTVLKLRKGKDINDTPYGNMAKTITEYPCNFVKLEPINDDLNKDFDFYTYEDIKPKTE